MLYLRYADDFVILLSCPHKEAVQIRQQIAEFLASRCGLELNLDKTVISSIRKGFEFLGASCRSLSRDNYFVRSTHRFVDGSTRNIKARPNLRMFITAPIKKIILKLLENGFVKRDASGNFIPTALKRLTPLDTYDIISFYNSKVKGLLSFYVFAGNYSSMAKVVWLLKQSCALTLALKFKLKTARKAYTEFGPNMTDPSTGLSFFELKSYGVKHLYPKSSTPSFDD